MYVVSRRGNAVHLVDTRSFERHASLSAGLGANRVAFSPDGRLALVPNMGFFAHPPEYAEQHLQQ